jgi:hypothetical protein
MDADRNGVPCETVYPRSEIDGYLDLLSPVLADDVFPDALSRELVPWARVDGSWYLVPFDGSDAWGESAETMMERPVVLYLLNTRGIVYQLDEWPARTELSVMDWQPGGKNALLEVITPVPGEFRWIAEAHLVRLEDMHSVSLERWNAGVDGVRVTYEFTRPTGRNLLRSSSDGTIERLERRSATGAFLATLAEQEHSEWKQPLAWLYRYDGIGVIVSGRDGLVAVSNTGERVRDLWQPAGMRVCAPNSWWDADTIVAVCTSEDPSVLPHEWFEELWLIDVDALGGRPLTDGYTRTAWDGENIVGDGGIDAAWPTEAGVLASWVGDCGAAGVAFLSEDGDLGDWLAQGTLLGIDGDAAVILGWLSCDGRPGSITLVALDGSGSVDLIRAEEPIAGVDGEVGKLVTPYP